MAEPSFGARAVAYKRSRTGLSARALSLEAGMSESYVGKYESGEIAEISLAAFARLAMTLGMNAPEVYAVMVGEARPEVAVRQLQQPFSVSPSCKDDTRP